MQPAKETYTGHAGSGEYMRTLLQGIASKARREKKHRFRNLYGMLNKRFLIESYYELNRRSTAGVDRISTNEYGEELEYNIINLVERLKGKRYRAKLVRRTYVPKSPDKLRPLGIPATEDKLLQNGAARILNAIFEQDFLSSSFGYRPNIGAGEAVQDVTSSLYWGRFSYIVDADIKGFFDNIDHDWLIKMLEQRIDDRAFTSLIKKW
jgi:retron-type reverse transcriptase